MALPETQFLLVTVATLLAASTVHASVGFGTALVAMPVLVPVLGIERAAPLVALAALSTQALVFARAWQSLDLRAAGQLLGTSTLGIPLGIVLIQSAPSGLIKGVLGVLIIGYALWSLTRPVLPRLRWKHAVYPFGFIAGVLAGAFNTNAPPIVIYGALSHWSPERFRATVSGYFLPTAIIVSLAHAVAGLWTREVLSLFVCGLPAIALGNWCGIRLAQRIPVATFTRVLYGILLVAGCVLLF